MATVRPDGRPLREPRYTYDAVGNVLSRTNAVPVATGSDFGGPSAQTSPTTTSTGDRRATGTTSSRREDRPLPRDPDYDTIHNMRSQSSSTRSCSPRARRSAAEDDLRLAYATPARGPHAATHIGERTFAYDANGNQPGWHPRPEWDAADDRLGRGEPDTEPFRQRARDPLHLRRCGGARYQAWPQGETVYVNPWIRSATETSAPSTSGPGRRGWPRS